MAEWNPNAPVVLGPEWFPTDWAEEPVDAGPAYVQRLPSTAAETITSVAMAATGNPGQNGILHTLVEVIPEGSEDPGPVQTIDLFPSADGDIGSWTTDTGSTTNIYQALQDPFIWPNLPSEPYIQTLAGFDAATFDVATAAMFGPGGALENARICRLTLGAIIQSITDPPTFLTLTFGLEHQGTTVYPPGGIVRDSHIFGALELANFGEINPATLLPWTPADVAAFDVGGPWRIRCASTFVFNGHPAFLTFGLRISYIETENRAAAGSWTRTGPPPGGIFKVETDDFVSLPDGTPSWNKPNGGDFLYVWRQARSTVLHTGTTLARDTHWLRAVQALGPDGNPPGISFPPGRLVSDRLTFDAFGLPTTNFTGDFRSAAAVVPLLSGGAASADGQPYRFTLADFQQISPGQTVGQAVQPVQNATYAGARTVVVPPASGGEALTISVHEVAGGTQVGGTVTWTAAQVRAVSPGGRDAARYLEGFFDTPASLVAGTTYEIRLTVTGSGWSAYMPDASIGPEASFGGTALGAFIGATMNPDRDLEATLMIAPAEPTDVAAEIAVECVTTYACLDEVQHVRLSWTPGTPALGDGFDHYDIQRQVTPLVPPTNGDNGEPGWVELARITTETTTEYIDRTAPRGHNVRYRIRAVGAGGAFSAWVETGAVTPRATGCEVIFTSEHDPSLEVVYERQPEVDYDFLDHQADQILPIYGADYQVAFFEPEDRGVAPSFTVWVNFADLPRDAAGNVIGGAPVFEPLRRITRATHIPYVVVLDWHGNVWRAHVTLSNGRYQEPGARYTVDVELTPLTGAAMPVVQ